MDLAPFDVLTFDCYGTLIDWEAGIVAALRREASWPVSDDVLLVRFAAHEAEAEAGEYIPYREVLASAAHGIARDAGVELSEDAAAVFGASVGDWPAFPDSRQALRRLAERYRLGVVTNCDEDLFAASNERLGVRFDWVITAERVRSYKPNPRHFEVALEEIGVPRERVLTWLRACSTTTCRRRGSASRPCGSIGVPGGPAPAPFRPRRPSPTPRTHRWRRSPTPPWTVRSRGVTERLRCRVSGRRRERDLGDRGTRDSDRGGTYAPPREPSPGCCGRRGRGDRAGRGASAGAGRR